MATPAETTTELVGVVPGLGGATGRAGPTKGVAIGEALGCGEGIGEADVVGGVAAGSGLAELVVCAAANAAAPHKKTGTRIPENRRKRRRFKRITQV